MILRLPAVQGLIRYRYRERGPEWLGTYDPNTGTVSGGAKIGKDEQVHIRSFFQ